MRFRRLYRLFTIILAVLFISVPSFTAHCASPVEAPHTIKVAYTGYNAFIEQDYNGYYEGYGVAYLNKIAQYTGWKYEYIRDTWLNSLDALENGQIDLICSAQWTDERSLKFEYSASPIGTEYSAVYTARNNDEIYYQDYENMDRARVAMLTGSYQNDQFAEHAREKGFTYQPVYYPTDSDAETAVISGKADMAVFGSLSRHDNLKMVDKFGPAPFYIITSKENSVIMDSLNEALESIHSETPFLEDELYQEYYRYDEPDEKPPLTRAEAGYIQNMSPLTVACIDGYYPLSYIDEDTGEPAGIYPDLVRAMADVSGLKLQLISIPEGEISDQLILQNKADMVAGALYSQEMIENPYIQLTDTITSQKALLVTRQGVNVYDMEELTIALPITYAHVQSLLPEEFLKHHLIYKNTTEECFESVRHGESDATIQNNLVANYYMQMDKYKSLNLSAIQSLDEGCCIMTSSSADRTLMSILNKTVSSLNSSTINQIILKYTTAQPYEETLSDVLYRYRFQLLTVLLCAAVIVAVFLIYSRQHTRMLLRLKEQEAYRLIMETDELTGLLNRKPFYEKAARLLKASPDEKFQILYFNIEHFKIINDMFGANAGDKLLCFLASLFKDWCSSHGGICSRFEADHFVVFIALDENYPQEIMDTLRRALKEYPLDIPVNISCGVYHIVDTNMSINIMCDRAHLAVNSIKGVHARNIAVYDDSNRKALIHEQLVLNEMDEALSKKQFHVYLQPKYNMTTGEVIGAEALVRWIHPERGIITPGEFIPIFEHNGFIAQLDTYMFEETCRILDRWRTEGRQLVPVSVNLSRTGFYNPNLCRNMCSIAEKYHIPPAFLEIEITETAYASDNDTIHERLQQLRDNGFHILMDDFGSGYSSLNMLKEAPIDEIKLDMRFLSAGDPCGRAKHILEMVIAMGNKIHIPVLAEGVETKSQVEMLKSYSCNLAQGFYYSRPLPVAEFEKLLQDARQNSF